MSTYLILSIDRGTNTASDAIDTVDLALKYRRDGIVVGVDLCGNPNKGDVSIYRAAFQKAKSAGLGMTVHFAETPSSGSISELETLLSYRPDRLGHVIHVPDELKPEIQRRELALELCMSCNVHAKMIPGGFLDHHFGEWWGRECPVVLCVSFLSFWLLEQVLIDRPMMWAFSAVRCRMSISLLRATLGCRERMYLAFVGGLWVRFLGVRKKRQGCWDY